MSRRPWLLVDGKHFFPFNAHGVWFNGAISYHQYKNSYCGDESTDNYRHNGNLNIGKTHCPLTDFMWNCTRADVSNRITICSSNFLMPSGNKPLPESMLTQMYVAIRRHLATMSFDLCVELHYSDAIMSVMASQITCLTIVYSTVYSGIVKRKHQSSASLAYMRGIQRWQVNCPHKGPVTRKMFPFDDVIMGACSR